MNLVVVVVVVISSRRFVVYVCALLSFNQPEPALVFVVVFHFFFFNFSIDFRLDRENSQPSIFFALFSTFLICYLLFELKFTNI